MTALNPNVMERIVERTELTTAAKAFTAQPHAMIADRCGVRAAAVRMPSGRKVPRQSPSGASRTTARPTRAPNGQPSARARTGQPVLGEEHERGEPGAEREGRPPA